MKTIKAILVDDEHSSITALSNLLLRFCPDVEIVATANQIDEAFEKINQFNPHILFLDVDMAPYSGFDLLRKFTTISFRVIFVTAYDYYAIDAIKFSASYYLLKPVKIEELREAVEKAKNEFLSITTPHSLDHSVFNDPSKIKSITIRSHQGINIIELCDLIFLQADNSYTTFILKSGEKIVSSKPLKEYEDMLQNRGFFRTHKSYIVNLQYVSSISSTEGDVVVLKSKDKVPLSVRRKEAFTQILEQYLS